MRILPHGSVRSWSGQARHHGILVQQLLQNQAISWGGRNVLCSLATHPPSSCFLHRPWTRLGAPSHCKAAATMVSICSRCHQELLFLPDQMHSKRKRTCLPFLPSFSSFSGHFENIFLNFVEFFFDLLKIFSRWQPSSSFAKAIKCKCVLVTFDVHNSLQAISFIKENIFNQFVLEV